MCNMFMTGALVLDDGLHTHTANTQMMDKERAQRNASGPIPTPRGSEAW